MWYCPICRGREIFPVAGGYCGQVYLCKDCGYRGSFILELDDEGSHGTTEKEKKAKK